MTPKISLVLLTVLVCVLVIGLFGALAHEAYNARKYKYVAIYALFILIYMAVPAWVWVLVGR